MVKRSERIIPLAVTMCAALVGSVFAQSESPSGGDVAKVLLQAAENGQLRYQLTTLEELKELCGPPSQEQVKKDGGAEVVRVNYAGCFIVLVRMNDKECPFTLRYLRINEEEIDIGSNDIVTLRDRRDLAKFDSFWGFANASLVNLDLRTEMDLLQKMPFDSRTRWPQADRLPKGFDPARILQLGKNPGLGVRALHQRGIDGKGVHVAIIDQPLLLGHEEYKSQLASYRTIDVEGVEPQMHGPPVASILVGKTCGVAPKAELTYYAQPSWKNDNTPYCRAINEIIDQNEELPLAKRIRVVSISTGMFPQQSHYDDWKKALARAEKHGLLIITCEPGEFKYGTLGRKVNGDPDNPQDCVAGKYTMGETSILVPASNRTTASHYGADVYTYWADGGMSWAAPYVAGLAALAYQVNPQVDPNAILRLLKDTSIRTESGFIANPVGFIEQMQLIGKTK